MTVRVYRWDDASAPVLTGEVGSLTALLKACLVTGYGSKAAAGWSNPYSATNVEAFTNSSAAGGTGYWIKVSHTNATYANVFAYESIDGSGNLTNQFPTTAQLAAGVCWYASSTASTTQRPWMIAADAKRAYLWVGYSVATTTGLVTTSYMHMAFAGDIASFNAADPYRFMLIGCSAASMNNDYFAGVSTTINTTAQAGHYIARDQTGASVSKAVGKNIPFTTNNTTIGTSTTTYPDPGTGGMLLSPIVIYGVENPYQIRGVMPGLYGPTHNLPGNPGDTLSGVGTLSGKDFILLDAANGGTRGRVVLTISGTLG